MKLACFGLWLKERGILHLKRASFALWLIEQGILHLKRAKRLENRGLSNRDEITGYRLEHDHASCFKNAGIIFVH